MKKAALITIGGKPIAMAEVREYKDPSAFIAQKKEADANAEEAVRTLKRALERVEELEGEVKRLWREIAADRGEEEQ